MTWTPKVLLIFPSPQWNKGGRYCGSYTRPTKMLPRALVDLQWSNGMWCSVHSKAKARGFHRLVQADGNKLRCLKRLHRHWKETFWHDYRKRHRMKIGIRMRLKEGCHGVERQSLDTRATSQCASAQCTGNGSTMASKYIRHL